jgi:serine/threonine protein kinase
MGADRRKVWYDICVSCVQATGNYYGYIQKGVAEEVLFMTDRSGQRFDNYRLIRLLGSGTFGEVYLGEHLVRQTQVAVKVLNMRLGQDELYDFINEARIFRLRHPHIVAVIDFGVERTTGIPFIVMNYASNGTLRQRHPRGTQVPFADVMRYVQQVASALQYAHEENLVHRDVKPENMLIDEQGNILLSDFGISIASQSLLMTQRQQEQMAAGTPTYMAAEQFMGRSSRASDQYALAVVTYEWLSGRCPFNGTFYELFGQHMQVPPPPLPRTFPLYSPECEQVIMKALAKNPEERFATVQEFAVALEEAYAQALENSRSQTRISSWSDYLQEGNSLYEQQRYAEAVNMYSQALALNPTALQAYYHRGLACRMLQNYQQALTDYNRVLELAPNDPIIPFVYNSRGYANFALQRYPEALADYNRALVLSPNLANAYINRGTAYLRQGALALALADYQRAVELEPQSPVAYYNRGNVYDDLGDTQKALADFDRALALDSGYANAYANRGYIYRKLGEYQKAIADYDRALALNPNNKNAADGRSVAYRELEKSGGNAG